MTWYSLCEGNAQAAAAAAYRSKYPDNNVQSVSGCFPGTSAAAERIGAPQDSIVQTIWRDIYKSSGTQDSCVEAGELSYVSKKYHSITSVLLCHLYICISTDGFTKN